MSSNPIDSNIAIEVENLSKCFHIYEKPQDRLLQMLMQGRNKYYQEFWALQNVSFEINKGETVAVIGRNGSGKSTLLQMLCGTLNPTDGMIKTNGRIAALLELGSGFNPEFTGRENVRMNAAILGLTNKEINARFNQIIAFADIGDFIEQPVKTYSSGMLMRLAFAVIAHVDAEILIIDEALSVGDAVFIQKCNLFLRRFIKQGTLLFVSHSMQSVLELCDRAIWLSDGKAHMDGIAKDVVQHYNAYVHQQVNVERTVQVVKGIKNIPGDTLPEELANPSAKSYAPDIKFRAEVFGFDFSSDYWGVGGAEVTNVEILDSADEKLQVISDCGLVTFRVYCLAHQELKHPIIGFSLRNHRGVELISENTSLGYLKSPPPIIYTGDKFCASFRFFLPYLPIGEYFVCGAIGEKLYDGGHVQNYRRDDILRISVISSHVVYSTFSMPMDACSIELR